MTAPKLPKLTISHPDPGASQAPLPAFRTLLELDGTNISQWVTDFRVGGEVKGAIEVQFKMLVSDVQWASRERKPFPE
jgi:hypothetical protein